MSGRRKTPALRGEEPAWRAALARLREGALCELAGACSVECDDRCPMAREDWAFVTSGGRIFLNPRRDAGVGEWEYILAHCMLHLGLGHLIRERLSDPLWQRACDLAAASFLRESRMVPIPSGYSAPLPAAARSAGQAYEQLRALPPQRRGPAFSTMSGGRPGMRWDSSPNCDYEEKLASSLRRSMKNAVRRAGGLEPEPHRLSSRASDSCAEARDWFLAHYPLLGAVAADFRIVEDASLSRREGVRAAAVNAQLKELYIRDGASLSCEEWKFVLAHAFLHAALRHDARCEDREPALWNIACDYVLNLWLREMHVGVMPEWGLYDEGFRGLTAEAVYDLLRADPRQYRGLALGDLICGDPDWWERPDGAAVDAFYRSALQQGLELHRRQNRGCLPCGLVEEIYAVSRPPIPWDVHLARWFDERFEPVERRRTYARLSRRQSAAPDIPRPARHTPAEPWEPRIFGVLLDTSGSMDRAALSAALGSIAGYSLSRDVRHVRVVFCDEEAYDQGVMSPEDLTGRVTVRGRGGTALQPGIDLLEEDRTFPKEAPLLIITDGYCGKRLTLYGRDHAFLVPRGRRLPFPPTGPVFRLRV